MFADSKLGKARQRNLGLSAVDAARLLRRICPGITARRLYRIEGGLAVPSKQEIAAISAVYGVATWEVHR